MTGTEDRPPLGNTVFSRAEYWLARRHAVNALHNLLAAIRVEHRRAEAMRDAAA